jgi:RNA-directed DNA polymerase
LEGKMEGTSSPETVSTKLQRIAVLAKRAPEMVITTLAHHIDVDWMREAYRRTRKDAAVGVDGQTAEEYETDLEHRFGSLLCRFLSGTYKAPPVRRVYILKGDGSKTRPIGIPTLEDKILQRAVAMVLDAVFEQDFRNCSYGFRPGRSAHQALSVLREGLMTMGGGWVIEVDIQAFFDTLDHSHLRSFLDRRVRDGVLRRMIDKWLKAGVLEEGERRYPQAGTPQGGVISPILANLYLHEVLDRWFEDVVRPRLKGPTFLVRYADDLVLAFKLEQDARRVMDVLPKRFGKYGLTLHPEKTRMIVFLQPGRKMTSKPPGKDEGPGSFDLLGFTHYWARSRKGFWVIKQKTARSRFSRALKRVGEWCRTHRHWPIAEQHKMLVLKLRGHFEYYGITGNSAALSRFRHECAGVWRKWLNRRSQRCSMPWERFARLVTRYPLPPAIAAHSVYRRAANP